MMKLKLEEAINVARNRLNKIASWEGRKIEDIRLEELEFRDIWNNWTVILSYQHEVPVHPNPLLPNSPTIKFERSYKRFTINSIGEVTAIKNPFLQERVK